MNAHSYLHVKAIFIYFAHSAPHGEGAMLQHPNSAGRLYLHRRPDDCSSPPAATNTTIRNPRVSSLKHGRGHRVRWTIVKDFERYYTSTPDEARQAAEMKCTRGR